jgi:hypothetical protein
VLSVRCGHGEDGNCIRSVALLVSVECPGGTTAEGLILGSLEGTIEGSDGSMARTLRTAWY